MHNTLDDKRELQQLWRLGALESITNIDHSQGSSSLLRCLSSPDDSSSAARTPLIRLMSFHCTFLRLCVVIRVRSHVQVHCTVVRYTFLNGDSSKIAILRREKLYRRNGVS